MRPIPYQIVFFICTHDLKLAKRCSLSFTNDSPTVMYSEGDVARFREMVCLLPTCRDCGYPKGDDEMHRLNCDTRLRRLPASGLEILSPSSAASSIDKEAAPAEDKGVAIVSVEEEKGAEEGKEDLPAAALISSEGKGAEGEAKAPKLGGFFSRAFSWMKRKKGAPAEDKEVDIVGVEEEKGAEEGKEDLPAAALISSDSLSLIMQFLCVSPEHFRVASVVCHEWHELLSERAVSNVIWSGLAKRRWVFIPDSTKVRNWLKFYRRRHEAVRATSEADRKSSAHVMNCLEWELNCPIAADKLGPLKKKKRIWQWRHSVLQRL
eukprot:PLAT12517.2.p1 GENE.PLAT12517.2~~PLAT12517.2.p1  ORF type:complete len:321 (-),score=75.33 PLAT12517.2:283-1245(-)